jgi:hypothetical protein
MSMPVSSESYTTPRAAAEAAGLAPWRVNRLIRRGVLPFRQLPGSRPEVRLADLLSLLESSRKPASVSA